MHPLYVEYCLSNVENDLLELLTASDVRTRPARCLGHCGICHRDQFVVVDGEIVLNAGDSDWQQSDLDVAALDESGGQAL